MTTRALMGPDEMIGLHFDTVTLPESNGLPAVTLTADDPLDYVHSQFAARGMSIGSLFPSLASEVPPETADASAGSATPVENASLSNPLSGLENALQTALRNTIIMLLAVGLILLGLWWIVNA